MVRALLDGSKTQTRRMVNFKDARGRWDENGFYAVTDKTIAKLPWSSHLIERYITFPYGKPGDRLWVRESHYLHGIWSVGKDDTGKRRWSFHPNQDMGVQFSEPNGLIKGRSTTVHGWYRRPSIHMPRWASRITLEVTGVRVERLQDISDTECVREGVTPAECTDCDGWVNAYSRLWESINGLGSWDANPWVWVIEFRRMEGGPA